MHSGCIRLLIFCAATGIVAAEAPSGIDPDALLKLAADKIEKAVGRQQRFTCDAMISREFYRNDTSGSEESGVDIRSQQRSLAWRDSLHVEVAVFDGRQFFSWPGTGAFRFESLNEMTGGGASSTGDFGPFAASFLADSDPASVRFRGVGKWAGQRIAEYSYEVPLVSSHYEIRTAPHRFERTAYEGSMFVDAGTGDLRRLVIKVPWPPPASGVLRVEVDSSYEPRRSGGSADLFPSASTLTMALNAGGAAINRTTYRSCRLFSSQSTLRFDAPSGAAPEPKGTATPSRLPAGLQLRSTMLTPIDSRTASAGDLFEARVVDPVLQGKQTIVPKGAVLHGRIVELEQQYYPSVSVRVMLRFSSVAFDGKSFPISLASRGPAGSTAGLPRERTAEREPENEEEHVASIWAFGTRRLRLDSHTVWLWETQ